MVKIQLIWNFVSYIYISNNLVKLNIPYSNLILLGYVYSGARMYAGSLLAYCYVTILPQLAMYPHTGSLDEWKYNCYPDCLHSSKLGGTASACTGCSCHYSNPVCHCQQLAASSVCCNFSLYIYYDYICDLLLVF